MHAGQVHVGAGTARQLIDEQFPQWRGESVTALPGSGTVNAIFRVGAGLTARFPLQGTDAGATQAHLGAEASALAEFAEACPFDAPTPVAIGRPGAGYPLPWSVQTWVDGEIATPDSVATSDAFAGDLARLIAALRAADPRGRRFAGPGRGGELRDHDEWMAVCLRESESLADIARLREAWAWLRSLPRAGADVMSHGDLTPPNVLAADGRLTGVLDGGGFGPADPALDLVSAWHLLDASARAVLRESIGAADTEWRRGAAWAFEQAMGLVWYYRETNPTMSAMGRSTLTRILDDPDLAL